MLFPEDILRVNTGFTAEDVLPTSKNGYGIKYQIDIGCLNSVVGIEHMILNFGKAYLH